MHHTNRPLTILNTLSCYIKMLYHPIEWFGKNVSIPKHKWCFLKTNEFFYLKKKCIFNKKTIISNAFKIKVQDTKIEVCSVEKIQIKLFPNGYVDEEIILKKVVWLPTIIPQPILVEGVLNCLLEAFESARARA